MNRSGFQKSEGQGAAEVSPISVFGVPGTRKNGTSVTRESTSDWKPERGLYLVMVACMLSVGPEFEEEIPANMVTRFSRRNKKATSAR